MDKTRIKILKDTVADGQRVKAGKVLPVHPDTARTLIQIGKAKLATAKAKKDEKESGDNDSGGEDVGNSSGANDETGGGDITENAGQ